MSSDNTWQSSQSDDIELELETSSTLRPPSRLIRFGHWLHRTRSTFVVLWILLMSEAVRGILIPTQSKFVVLVGGNESFVGLTVGAFSGGRLAMTILLGAAAGILSYKTMFLITSAMLVVSNLGYALAGVAHSKWLIFFSRIGLGLGAGTLSLVRAYFADCYDEANRSTILAVAAAVQYGGFALFPGVGTFLDLIGEKFKMDIDGDITTSANSNLVMNEYTAPAWLMIFLNIVSIIALLFSFSNPPQKPFKISDLLPFYHAHGKLAIGAIGRSIKRAFRMGDSRTDLHSSNSRIDPSLQVDEVEMIELETAVKNSTESGKDEAVDKEASDDDLDEVKIDLEDFKDDLDSGESFNSGRSSLESLENLEAGNSGSTSSSDSKWVTAIWISFLTINFLIRVVLGTIEVLGATLYDLVTKKYLGAGETAFSPSSGTFYTILGVVGVGVVIVLAIFAKKIPDEIPFLVSLIGLFVGSLTLIGTPLNMGLARFTIGTGMMYTIGYPLAQSVVVSMFSKIPASQRNQAVSMSWIGSAGSVGRIIGPIIVGAIYQHSGAPATFIFNSAIAATLLALSIGTIYAMKIYKKQ